MYLYAAQELPTQVYSWNHLRCHTSSVGTEPAVFAQRQYQDLCSLSGLQVSVVAGRFLEQDVQVAEETMNLNYFGTLRVLKAYLPGMVRRGKGEVVLVSSAAAVCGTTLLLIPFNCRLALFENNRFAYMMIIPVVAPHLSHAFRCHCMPVQQAVRQECMSRALQVSQATARTRPARQL